MSNSTSSSRRNLAVVYQGPFKVEVKDIGYPKMVDPRGNPAPHAVIVKTIATNICGSDLHMYRGRTSFPAGMAFGHEITGEVVEIGSHVLNLNVGDWISVPFNISCGNCQNCKERLTSLCLTVNPKQPGGAYGYADMGGWQGGQAEYVLIPYADWNALVLPKPESQSKILDLAMLSDILPTGFNAATQAGVTVGKIVSEKEQSRQQQHQCTTSSGAHHCTCLSLYSFLCDSLSYVAGAGPVGICCAASCVLLGAALVVVGDMNASRLSNIAKLNPCIRTLDLTKVGTKPDDLKQALKQLIGREQVDCSCDCVGFESCGHGSQSTDEKSNIVLNSCFSITKAGGRLGIPGLYPAADPGAKTDEGKDGILPLKFGSAWVKSIRIECGQCPVMTYHRELMLSIIHSRIKVSEVLNAKVISLEQAPEAYKSFSSGEAVKYIFDPHKYINRV